MPLQQTSGNDTQDAYGGGAAAVPNYIENVFSTYLYTGNGTSQTITNGIDLAGKGGLAWTKVRSNTGYNHLWFDTIRGPNNPIFSINSNPQSNVPSTLTSFNSNGISVGSNAGINTSSFTYASWTFRKQPKFFDVVTYTGTGANRTIAHNLGSAPGCIIVKRTDASGNWQVYHSGLTSAAYSIQLNLTNAQASATTVWNSTAPTSSVFSVGTDATVNASGGTYVAYLFASNAGGFGLTGTDNVISCGSYTGTGAAGNNVTLGYEPQMIFIKCSSSTGNWYAVDTMRGFADLQFNPLFPNLTNAEVANSGTQYMTPNATGFTLNGTSGAFNGAATTYIYIAIRRGPMAVPTDPTTVFVPIKNTASSTPVPLTTNFVVDSVFSRPLGANNDNTDIDRLRGSSKSSAPYLWTDSLNAEANNLQGFGLDNNTGITDAFWFTTSPMIYWNFARAPRFFDEVCYTGTGSATTFNHNLGAVPELMIIKDRSNSTGWPTYVAPLGIGNYIVLNTTQASAADPGNVLFNNTAPTSSVFSVGTSGGVNGSGDNYVAYLFATCPGVSKVGSYTGTGGTQSIACGFGAGGARFILAKRTDSTGDWYVWDSANGLTSGSSPYLQWDTAAAQTTGNNGTYASSGGFTLTSASPVNTSGGSFIFLAIA